MTRTRIKICGLTREQDVDAAVEAGADAVGFVFYPPSRRCITPERARQLANRLPPFVSAVGLFVNADAAVVRATAETARLQLLQCTARKPRNTARSSPCRTSRRRAWCRGSIW